MPFTFVINVKELVDADHFEIIPGHTLKRATADEIDIIKKKVQSLRGGQSVGDFTLWETSLEKRDFKKFLPKDQWRYFVIEFHNSNEKMNTLLNVFNITPKEIETGFMGGELVSMHSPEHLFNVINDGYVNSNFFVDISISDIENIKDLFNRLESHDHETLDLNEVIKELQQLKKLPFRSPLRLLGYFCVLEALLIHSPDPKDPVDSITRQMKAKIRLLDNRWENKLDYTPFGSAKPDKVWTKMYAYRSSIAHGNMPRTKQLLEDMTHEGALNLVKQAVKSVIRQGLIEPVLIRDLKQC